jgi:hypothetical protein
MLPVACTLSDEHLHCHAADLLPALQSRASMTEWLNDGMRFTFDATSDHLSSIASVIDRERHCCQFLTFELAIPPGRTPFTLTLHGPPGTREFLAGIGMVALASTQPLAAGVGDSDAVRDAVASTTSCAHC